MTAENISETTKAITAFTESDRPFMVLFIIVMLFLIFLAMRGLKYIMGVNENHKTQMDLMNSSMTEQRNSHFKMVAEDRRFNEKREREILKNLEKNTEQLTDIAYTIRDIQYNMSSLEGKVVGLEQEVRVVKDKVDKKEDQSS